MVNERKRGVHVFRLADAIAAFAVYADLPLVHLPEFDRRVRNLTQRHYVPPASRRGRADLYSLETICALHIAVVLTDFGLSRTQIDEVLHFLLVAGREKKKTHIKEAVARAQANEAVLFGLERTRGVVVPHLWFPDKGEAAPATKAALRIDAADLLCGTIYLLEGHKQ